MDDKARRHNQNKMRPSLIPVVCLIHIIKVLEFGAIKYGPSNWKKGLSFVECTDSLERHLIAFKMGENFDGESKLLHLGHICANAIFLMYFILTSKTEMDDRGKE